MAADPNGLPIQALRFGPGNLSAGWKDLAGGLASKKNLLGLLTRFDFFDGFGFWDWSHWIRVEIPCKTAVVSRPELPRRPHSKILDKI